MPTFVEITPDPFAESFRGGVVGDANEDGTFAGSTRAQRSSFEHVRRPTRGIQIKSDTYATLQVRTADGRNIPLLDSGSLRADKNNPDVGVSDRYSNFVIQAMQEERAEKMQIVQTFGEPFVFFFGEHPRIIQGSGVLVNTEDFNWRAEFWENYDRYLRGTKCVQNKTRVTLSWDDIVVEGYFVKASAAETSQEPYQVQFNFQMFLTNYQNVSKIGHTEFPKGATEINQDPNTVDIGNLQSSTQEVRRLNSTLPGTKNSLLQTIREQITSVVTFNGQLQSILELANQFVSGRNIRVPIGFAGGAVFDEDLQIALASVPISNRQIILNQELQDAGVRIPGLLGNRFQPAKFGKISDNVDEYVARTTRPSGGPVQAPDLFAGQRIEEKEVEGKVRAIFESFGVDTDPPNEAEIAARRAVFATLAVSVGAVTSGSGTASSLRQFTNAIF